MPSPHSRSPLRCLVPASPGPAPAPSAPTGPDRAGPATAAARDQRRRARPRGATACAQPRARGVRARHAGSCSSRPTGPKEAGKVGRTARLPEERLPPGHSHTGGGRGTAWATRSRSEGRQPLSPSIRHPFHTGGEIEAILFYRKYEVLELNNLFFSEAFSAQK